MALDKKAERVSGLIEELVHVMMWLVHHVMKLAPLGVMGLLYRLASTQSIALFQELGLFIVVVFAATLWHGFINIPAMLFLLTRRNPFTILWHSQRSLWTAFSTSSSSATLPVTLDIVQNKLKVDPSIGTFVSTIGSSVNMDGTVLYEAMAALFVATLLGIHLSLAQQGMVMFMSSIAAIGAPGIPSAGMVTLILVLQSVGLPAEAVALLLPIDRLLDTVRTMVNVEGDIIGSVIVDHHITET